MKSRSLSLIKYFKYFLFKICSSAPNIVIFGQNVHKFMFFNDICVVHWSVKIWSHSYSECFNELTFGICSNNLNGMLLAIPMAQKYKNKTVHFETENPQKYSGQYDAMKLLIKAISVTAKVLSYYLRHHSVCLYKTLHV